MVRTSKNISIYIDFGRNCLIKAINGSNETVHCELFFVKSRPFDRDRTREMTPHCRTFKTRKTLAIGSWSDGSDAFYMHFNLDRYNSWDQRSRLDAIRVLRCTMCPPILSDDRRHYSIAWSNVSQAATSPPHLN